MGWELVARNWRSRSGEIDLVFYDRDTLVFVEVKTRRGIGLHPPEFNFSGEKFKRIEALAWNFLERYELGEIPVRYDLAAVETDDQRHYRIRHYRGVCGDDW
jgi:putative endonuclease